MTELEQEQIKVTLTTLQKQRVAELIRERFNKHLWKTAANHLGAYLVWEHYPESDIEDVFRIAYNDFYNFKAHIDSSKEVIKNSLHKVLLENKLDVEHGEKAFQMMGEIIHIFEEVCFLNTIRTDLRLDTVEEIRLLSEQGVEIKKPCLLLNKSKGRSIWLTTLSSGIYKAIINKGEPELKTRLTTTKIDQIYKVKHYGIDQPLYIIQIGTKYLIGDKKTIINELQKESRIEQHHLPLLEQLIEEPYNHGNYTTVQYMSKTWYIEEAPAIRIYDPYDLRGKLLKESSNAQKIDYQKLLINYFAKNKPELRDVAVDQLTKRTNFTETIKTNFEQFTKGCLYLYSPQEDVYYVICKQTNFSQIVTPEIARSELVPIPGWQALKKLIGFKAGSYKLPGKRIDYFKFILTEPL